MAVIIDQKNQALDHPCLPNANRMLVSQGGTRAVTNRFLQQLDRHEQVILRQELVDLCKWSFTAIHGHRRAQAEDLNAGEVGYAFGTGTAVGIAVGAFTGGIGGIIAGYLWTSYEGVNAEDRIQQQWDTEEQIECRQLTEVVIRTAFTRACRLASKLDAIELECDRLNRENEIHMRYYGVMGRLGGVLQGTLNVWQRLTSLIPFSLQQPAQEHAQAVDQVRASQQGSISAFASNCKAILELQNAHSALKEVHDGFLQYYHEVAQQRQGIACPIGRWKFAVEFLDPQGTANTGRPDPTRMRIRLLGRR